MLCCAARRSRSRCPSARCSLLAAPIFGLHIGANGVSTLPSSLPSKQGYVLLQRAFPVQNPEPVRVVAVGGDPARVHRDLVQLNRRLAAEAQLRRGRDPVPGVHVALLTSPVRGDPVGGAAVEAVRDLRGARHSVDLRRQRGEGLRGRRHRGERRLLRRGDEPDSVRPRSSCSGSASSCSRSRSARSSSRSCRSCSTCSRSAPRTAC